MAAAIVVPETVNVCASEALPKLVLNGNNVSDKVMAAEVGFTVHVFVATVRWVAPGLFKVMLPLYVPGGVVAAKRTLIVVALMLPAAPKVIEEA
jgi:hypothetical protein